MKLTQATIAQLKPQDKRKDYSDDSLKGLFVRVEVSGVKTWYLRYAHSHTIKIGRVDYMTPPQARDKAMRLLSQFATTGSINGKTTAKVNTLGELISEYMEHGGSDNIRKAALYGFSEDMKLSEITASWFEKWRVKFCQTHKKATANKRLMALRVLLKWGQLNGLCNNALQTLKRLPETDSKVIIRYLSEDERKHLFTELDKMPTVFQAVVKCALWTGIRRGALLNIKWTDIDFKTKSIMLRAENAKNKKTITLPLSERVVAVLKSLPHKSEYVFDSEEVSTVAKLYTVWRKLLKRANIQNLRFHDLRHDFASQLVMKGVDLNTVRELLTHSDISMTMRYAHLAPSRLKKAVDLL